MRHDRGVTGASSRGVASRQDPVVFPPAPRPHPWWSADHRRLPTGVGRTRCGDAARSMAPASTARLHPRKGRRVSSRVVEGGYLRAARRGARSDATRRTPGGGDLAERDVRCYPRRIQRRWRSPLEPVFKVTCGLRVARASRAAADRQYACRNRRSFRSAASSAALRVSADASMPTASWVPSSRTSDTLALQPPAFGSEKIQKRRPLSSSSFAITESCAERTAVFREGTTWQPPISLSTAYVMVLPLR